MKVKPTVTELFGVLHRFSKSNECMKFLRGRVHAYVGIVVSLFDALCVSGEGSECNVGKYVVRNGRVAKE